LAHNFPYVHVQEVTSYSCCQSNLAQNSPYVNVQKRTCLFPFVYLLYQVCLVEEKITEKLVSLLVPFQG